MRGQIALVLWGLLPVSCFAQHVSIHAGAPRPAGLSGNFGNFGLPPVAPIPPIGLTTPGNTVLGTGNFRRRGFGGFGGFGDFGGFGGFGWGGFPGYWDTGYGGYPASPMVIVLAPQPQEAPPPPPEPARPEIREYKQQAAPVETAAAAQPSPAAFSLITSDGGSWAAIAVWVQNQTVKFVSPDGVDGELPLGMIDRQATMRANAAKQLTLQLPVARSTAVRP